MSWPFDLWRWLSSHILRLYEKIPSPHLWFWPIIEVGFIAIFSLSPLLINADTAYLYSEEPSSFSEKFNKLLENGQLMYYSLGFVATSAWMLLMTIRRPRIMMLIIFGVICYSLVRVSTSIGVDPAAENLNLEAFRNASYTVFTTSLFLYLICNVLAAWQKRLRPTFDQDANEFEKNYEHPEA